jgi:hypothetical protein
MSLIADIKRDVRTARKIRLSWRGLLCVMAGALVVCGCAITSEGWTLRHR